MTLCKRSLLLLVSLAVSGCAKQPLQYQVEVCLSGARDKDGFISFMRTVAHNAKLEFLDGSAEIEADARSVAAARALVSETQETIYFGAESESGSAGFTGGNLGLNPFQIGLGFTPSRDETFGTRTVNDTIDEIGRRWTARRIPANEPFKRRPGCGDE